MVPVLLFVFSQAVTALALCNRLAAESHAAESSTTPSTTRKAAYLVAMRKYATFVLEGSAAVPLNKKGTVSM